MKLRDFVAELQKLVDDGNGDLMVFYRHQASGDCGDISYASVQNEPDNMGPFDLKDGEHYVEISVGDT